MIQTRVTVTIRSNKIAFEKDAFKYGVELTPANNYTASFDGIVIVSELNDADNILVKKDSDNSIINCHRYSVSNPRLVDISDGGSSYTFANGLTETDSVVALGGTLNSDTSVNILDHSLTIGFIPLTEGGMFATATFGTDSITLQVADQDNLSEGGSISISGNSAAIEFNSNNNFKGIVFGEDNAIVYDTDKNKGLEYDGDYEANFTGRSLITKQFADANYLGLTPTTAVVLSIGSNTFNINDTQSDNGLNISESNGLYMFGFADSTGVFKGSELSIGHDYLFLDVYNTFAEGIEGVTAGLKFMADGSGMFVEDLLRNVGLQNSGDYEANFTNRSLATVQYISSTAGGLRATDIEITDDTKGIILKDTFDGSRRRITLTSGVLVISSPL